MLPIVIAAVAGILLVVLIDFLKRPDKNEGVDIEAEAKDDALIGPVTTALHVPYPGTRPGESGKAIARYDTTYEGGGLRVSKWVLSNKESYMTLSGHFVLYQFYRQDGSLEYDKLVHPAPSLGGVYVKVRLRYFNAQNEQVEERYLREDGGLGVRMDVKTGLYQQFCLDGKSLRLEQITLGDNKYRQIRYRLDGKTVWFETDPEGTTRVYFDNTGRAVDLTFTRERAIGSYGMGPESQPLLTSYDRYTRPDGTLAYKQTWYARWDKAANTSVDTLGAVVLYDSTGSKPVAEYSVELLPASEPLFIRQVVLHNSDGTRLVRLYRSPGCRLSEDIYDSSERLIRHSDFGSGDQYRETVSDIVFQGFNRQVWGFWDDEAHDI